MTLDEGDIGRFAKRLSPAEYIKFKDKFTELCAGISHTINAISSITCQATGRLGARQVDDHGWIRVLHRVPRYGDVVGQVNEHLLDPELFKSLFLGPLTPYQNQIDAIIFEFGHIKPADLVEGRDFVTAALYERFTSSGEADYQDKLLSAMRFGFGGHLEKADAKK